MCTGGPRLHSVNYFPCLPWRNLQGSSPDSRKLRRKRRLNLDVVSFQLLFLPLLAFVSRPLFHVRNGRRRRRRRDENAIEGERERDRGLSFGSMIRRGTGSKARVNE